MSRGLSLAARGVLAIALMVGFYTLALVIASGLLYIPYAEWVYLNRIHFKLALGCIVGAGVVLWSILPRFDRFKPPGPELQPSDQPEFFEVIRSIAVAAGQAAPAHVYLTLEVNAWVTERGGIMGLGSRRVMGVGLPLLQALTVDEMRAVIAHEFGHYSGGDTKLGPWVYKTRAAIERSIANLNEDSWVRLPFLGYGKLFMRVTSTVSRQQEYAADALAARIVGADALSSGLKKLGGVSAAFNGFWRQEYAPVLEASHRAPLASGFAAFLECPKIAARVAELSAEELNDATGSPYDSHPPTATRCAVLASIGTQVERRDQRPATALLHRLRELERELLMTCVDAGLDRTELVDWESVPERVWIEQWRKHVAAQAQALASHTVSELAELAAEPAPIAKRMRFDSGYLPNDEDRRASAIRLLATALGITLYASGWTVAGQIGEPLTFHKAGETLEPFSLLERLASDEHARVDWPDRAQTLGISSLMLNPVAVATTAGD
jgi:Zn-dependent protease with chaperone function